MFGRILLISFLSPVIAGASAGITYHGRLLRANGEPVTSANVTFKIQIRTPGSENCLLYEEQQVKDLSAAKGAFAVTINDGTATVMNVEPFGLHRAFQNRGTFNFTAGKCAAGTTYAPNPTDGRKIAVEFNDGSFTGWEPVPAQNINFVPMALESMTVGGFGANNLVRVVDSFGAPAVVSPLTQTQHNNLVDILNGAGGIAGNAAGFTGSLSGDVTGTQGATVVTKIQGRAVDIAAPANGQALVWSAGNSRWEPGTVSGGGSADWSTLTGKPSTFPSDWSTLANKPASFASDWSTLANKPTSFASDWSTLTNKPATFSPSAHSHPINEISSGTGAYFNYSPNGTACAAGEILKWDTGGGGRWICGVDAGSAGALASLTVNAPLVKTGTGSDPVLSVSDASTSAKGIVQLASSSDTTSGLAVQANDTRLTDSRAPSGSASGELAGNYPNPTVVASVSSSASSLVRRSAGGQIQSASADFGSVGVNNGGGSIVTIQTPAAFTSYTLKLPSGAGSNGQILTSNGTDMVWANASSITASNVSGIVAIANGGTGASTASAARTNLGITATGDSVVTATSAANARSAISALSDTDSRLAPTPAAGNALNYVRVNAGGTAYEARSAANVLSDIGAMANISAGTNGNVLTSNGTTWSSTALPVATTGVKGLMQVGTGLAVSSGTVSADFGTGAGEVAQGNDSRFPASTCAGGNKMRWDGTAWQCEADNATDTTKVAKAGDTMSGSLTLSAGTLTVPANGLVVGTNQLVASGGNIGIGTNAPGAKLDVVGKLMATAYSSVSGTDLTTGTPLDAIPTGAGGGDFAYTNIATTTGYGSFTGLRFASPTVGSNDSKAWIAAVYNTNYSYDLMLWSSKKGNSAYGTKSALNAIFSQTSVSFRTGAAGAGDTTERLRIDSSGNVGIGTTGPRGLLEVNGTLVGKAATVNASATINFATGNLQYTTSSCGAFILNNMKDGATYSFSVKGTTSATCSFTAYSDVGVTALTVHLPPDHAATIEGTHTLYNFMVMGPDVYVSWIPGY